MILGTFTKQPSESFGYDLLYSDFLGADVLETILSTSCVNTSGEVNDLEVEGSYLLDAGTRVKVFVSGGTAGNTYKITILVKTLDGIVKEDEFKIKVKDY